MAIEQLAWELLKKDGKLNGSPSDSLIGRGLISPSTQPGQGLYRGTTAQQDIYFRFMPLSGNGNQLLEIGNVDACKDRAYLETIRAVLESDYRIRDLYLRNKSAQ